MRIPEVAIREIIARAVLGRGALVRRGRAIALAGLAAGCTMVQACTIFVLTDSNHVFFCNNEDWSNPKTRIWFVPSANTRLGCVYVGFDNGWAQGGMNTEGLAFDWVAGFEERWARSPEMMPVHGNPSERMLQTCRTIKDVAQFYRKNYEPSFSYAKILVADRMGASAIIGATNGKLTVEESRTCRGFGYARRVLNERLAAGPEVSVASGGAILRACLQEGQYATKYSSVFDLKNGDIFLFRFPAQADPVKLNFIEELRRGAHYYDIPELKEQLGQAQQPLLDNMQRFFISDMKAIPENDLKTTQRLQALLQDALHGTLKPEDCAPAFWNAWSAQQEQNKAEVAMIGGFESLTLVKDEPGKRSRWYRAEFQNASLLLRFTLDPEGKLAGVDDLDRLAKPIQTPDRKREDPAF